jgi:hypothetical protein
MQVCVASAAAANWLERKAADPVLIGGEVYWSVMPTYQTTDYWALRTAEGRVRDQRTGKVGSAATTRATGHVRTNLDMRVVLDGLEAVRAYNVKNKTRVNGR